MLTLAVCSPQKGLVCTPSPSRYLAGGSNAGSSREAAWAGPTTAAHTQAAPRRERPLTAAILHTH